MSRHPTQPSQSPAAEPAKKVFADLRRHNEYAARVARLLDEKRKRHIAEVVRVQRKHRVHQAR